jgi:hypothetical protein
MGTYSERMRAALQYFNGFRVQIPDPKTDPANLLHEGARFENPVFFDFCWPEYELLFKRDSEALGAVFAEIRRWQFSGFRPGSRWIRMPDP